MEEYKGNSNKAKEQQKALPPEKKVEKIVSGPVKSKKKNSIQKITSIFVPEDVEDVKSYIFEDIVVPAVKDIILDAVRALLGVSGKSNKGAPASKVSYRLWPYENTSWIRLRRYRFRQKGRGRRRSVPNGRIDFHLWDGVRSRFVRTCWSHWKLHR